MQIDDFATSDDEEQFPEAWRLFQKRRQVRNIDVKGYPLSLWPVVSPAELQTLITRDIVTVEQLAEAVDIKGNKLPAPIVELGQRAKKLLAMQGKVGKFEAIIHELEAQRDQLSAELVEARGTISAQTSMLNQMRPQPAQAA